MPAHYLLTCTPGTLVTGAGPLAPVWSCRSPAFPSSPRRPRVGGDRCDARGSGARHVGKRKEERRGKKANSQRNNEKCLSLSLSLSILLLFCCLSRPVETVFLGRIKKAYCQGRLFPSWPVKSFSFSHNCYSWFPFPRRLQKFWESIKKK